MVTINGFLHKTCRIGQARRWSLPTRTSLRRHASIKSDGAHHNKPRYTRKARGTSIFSTVTSGLDAVFVTRLHFFSSLNIYFLSLFEMWFGASFFLVFYLFPVSGIGFTSNAYHRCCLKIPRGIFRFKVSIKLYFFLLEMSKTVL